MKAIKNESKPVFYILRQSDGKYYQNVRPEGQWTSKIEDSHLMNGEDVLAMIDWLNTPKNPITDTDVFHICDTTETVKPEEQFLTFDPMNAANIANKMILNILYDNGRIDRWHTEQAEYEKISTQFILDLVQAVQYCIAFDNSIFEGEDGEDGAIEMISMGDVESYTQSVDNDELRNALIYIGVCLDTIFEHI